MTEDSQWPKRGGMTSRQKGDDKPVRVYSLAHHEIATPSCGDRAEIARRRRPDGDNRLRATDKEKGGNVTKTLGTAIG